MIYEIIKLWGENTYQSSEENSFIPTLTTYVLNGSKKRGAVLILPGGGYTSTSPREAEPIALQFNAAGYHTFVLDYSVAPRRHPQPLLDASRAMCIIRKNAEEWNVDSEKIAVCGFSAGGHLAASLGVYWHKGYLSNVTGMEIGLNRPNALILAYPVITSGQYAHRGSFINLLGEEASSELLYEMSLEHHVSEKTPPAFIWHTFEDQGVPVENSLLFALSLRNKSIPFELHIYPEGEHGLSLATEETATSPVQVAPHAATWMKLCIEWLNLQFK
ncbi:MAG TPA: alpha/beta hydrolase [Clostridiaceae bacterium]|jgi:acetyl esterase/lipase|nr:alpha/beta hydrolase [Clostridiaceae bacterium]